MTVRKSNPRYAYERGREYRYLEWPAPIVREAGRIKFNGPYRFSNGRIVFVCPVCGDFQDCGSSGLSALTRHHEALHWLEHSEGKWPVLQHTRSMEWWSSTGDVPAECRLTSGEDR